MASSAAAAASANLLLMVDRPALFWAIRESNRRHHPCFYGRFLQHASPLGSLTGDSALGILTFAAS
jgi:hypothetical protein